MMVNGPWPSVVTFLRVFHGAVTDLDEVFLPSYYHFWPRLDFWPNTALVLVWDEESEEDRKAARRLHDKWDAIFANKERLASGVNPRSWQDPGAPFESPASASMAAPGSRDSPRFGDRWHLA